MQTSILTAAARRVQELAREYQDRGYEVAVEPKSGQLPARLADFQPDLVARKGDDVVVVEVKPRGSLSDPKLRELAKSVREQPGWRFELIVLQPEPGPPGARAWSAEDVADNLRQVEAIREFGYTGAALLLAWSAAEATLQLLAHKEGLTLEREDAVYLLKLLVTRAVITREQYKHLWECLELRNALAHGLEPGGLDATRVDELGKTIAELLRRSRPRRPREQPAFAGGGPANR